MKFVFTALVGAVLMLSVITACQSSAAPANISKIPSTPVNPAQQPTENHAEHEDDAPRITLADAKKDFDAGIAIFVDTRSEDAYKIEHIKGAINVPANMLAAKMKDIPTGKKIIAYCS